VLKFGKKNRELKFKKSKGGLYMVEVLIVVSIMITSFVVFFSKPRISPKFSVEMIKNEGFWALRQLDSKGFLRMYVENNDVNSINSELSKLLPNTMRYDVSICQTTCTNVSLPVNETVVVVNYYLYGWKKVNPKEIRIYMWSE